MFAKGQTVEGMYLGTFPFRGTIICVRPIMVKTDGCIEVTVKADSPLTVYGREADVLLICAKHDGSPSSYSCYKDELYAV